MAYTLANTQDNIITLTNTDNANPLLYTIYVLNSSNVFEVVTSFPSTPTLSLASLASINIDLKNDGIYELVIANSPSNLTAYFLLDANIKLCEKTLTLTLWCENTPTTICQCDAFTVKAYNLMKFKEIKKALYFEWNKWVQTQSIIDLITPSANQLLSMSEWLTQLTNICDTCSDNGDCGCGGQIRSSNSDCGCS